LLGGRGRAAVRQAGLAFGDRAAGLAFRAGHLAPAFSDAEVTRLERFPVNSYLVADPEVDLDDWRLEVSGLVKRAGEYTLDDLRRLPQVTQNTRHLCIAGWDVGGNFGGVRIAHFLGDVGAAPDARLLELRGTDGRASRQCLPASRDSPGSAAINADRWDNRTSSVQPVRGDGSFHRSLA